MGRLRGLFARAGQTDEERLDEEIRSWAESLPGTRRISDCPTRERVRVAGSVRRLTIRPEQGMESLEALVSDGTGNVVVRWMGRHRIPGLHLGTRVVLEGVIGGGRDEPTMVNPQFEFA